jgi:hypothetical protein
MPDKKKWRVVTVHATDQQQALGMDWRDDLPAFSRGEVIHSTNPAIPLTDRSPRFLTVIAVYPTRDDSVGIVEISEAAPHVEKASVPSIWHRGHEIRISFFLGTGSAYESPPIPTFWEVTVDGGVIGTLSHSLTSVQAAAEAVILADAYIERRLIENKSRF